MAKLKALVVDDDEKFMSKLGSFLKVGFDCDIVLKSNGTDAISALDKERFDILLLDLKMPGIDGFTVLSHAKKINPKTTVIVISGILDHGITKKVEDAGAWYMAKPLESLNALEHLLKGLIKKNY